MLEVALETKELTIQRQDVNVQISDERFLPLTLQLPSAAELHQIEKLLFSKVSAAEVFRHFDDATKLSFRAERDRLLKKYDKYKKSPTFMSHLTTLTEFSGDFNGVIDVLRDGAAIDSTDFHLHHLARAFIALNDLSEAENVFSNADLKTNAEANLGLACLAILRDEYSRASEFVSAALDIDETNFNGLLLAGVLELGRGQLDKAIRYLRSATEERTNSAAAYVLLGTAYYRMGRKDKALDVLKRAVALNPIDQNAVILYADILLMEQRAEEVIRLLENFTRFEEKSVAAWDRLGRAFYHLKKNSKALSAFKHQASILDNCSVWNNIGLAYWRMGETNRAWNYLSLALTKSVEENFSTFLPLYNCFVFLRNRGSLHEALKLTEMIPTDRISDLAKARVASVLLALRCEALAELGHVEKAEHEIDALLNSQALHRDLYRSLLLSATFFYSLAKPDAEKALHCVQLTLHELKSVDIEDKRKSLLYNNAIFVLAEFGKHAEAEKLMPNLSSWVHKSPTATATLGLIHLRKGRLESGKRLYKEAISLAVDPRMKSRLKKKMQLEVGKVLLEQGRLQAASRSLKEAAESELKGISAPAADFLKTLAR